MLYTFNVLRFHIESMRSAHNDTLIATSSLKVMNENGGLHQDYGNKMTSLGDHKDKETVLLNMAFQKVDVPNPSSPNADGGAVYWSFLLANTGHKDSGFTAIFSKMADAYAGAFAADSLKGGQAGVAAFLSLASVLGAQELLSLMTANCDGMVAAGTFAYTAKQLAQMSPAINHVWANVQPNPGTDSPSGCGDNSSYDVRYEVNRVG